MKPMPLSFPNLPIDLPENLPLPDLRKAIHAGLGWHRHPRTGKIGRLPEPIREQINVLLENGLIYRDIIKKLEATTALPYKISEMNLSRWYHGGHQDWLKRKLLAAAGLDRLLVPTRPPATPGAPAFPPADKPLGAPLSPANLQLSTTAASSPASVHQPSTINHQPSPQLIAPNCTY